MMSIEEPGLARPGSSFEAGQSDKIASHVPPVAIPGFERVGRAAIGAAPATPKEMQPQRAPHY
jgi:hypothetical protein